MQFVGFCGDNDFVWNETLSDFVNELLDYEDNVNFTCSEF